MVDNKLLKNPRLIKLIIKNFRCIGNTPVEIDLDEIVVLVGPNNTGKSSILKAYEVAMSEGSKGGELKLEDFPNGKIDPENLPEIELHTIVYDNSPGEEWISTTSEGENLVKEKWIWHDVGKPIRYGYLADKNRWANDSDKEKVPWGAPNIANARRPQPHRVNAFDSPEKQTESIVKLLITILNDRISNLKEESQENKDSVYVTLLENIKKIQKQIVEDCYDEIKKVEMELTDYISKVFPGNIVIFDAKPEKDLDKAISWFESNPELRMGPADGYQSSMEFQGSGARRTLLWSALRLITESEHIKSNNLTRPNVLLLDEPEICLHPNAIREACDLLYSLPNSSNWQVMITTHSPCFIDLSKNNTTIIRVEIMPSKTIVGTTLFRPKDAQLSPDDKKNLKLLNLCDPYVAEFFFGGKNIIVEGDTEYTAFKYLISEQPEKFKNIHLIRARGKATIVSLVKILNHFGSSYSILHDSDTPENNAAWTENSKILSEIQNTKGGVRLVASIPNFEIAFFSEKMQSDKPYNALKKIKENADFYKVLERLLEALVDHKKPLPKNSIEWDNIEQLTNILNSVTSP